MSGLLSHSKNSIPVWFRLFWRAEELHALSYVLLCTRIDLISILHVVCMGLWAGHNDIDVVELE